MKPKRFTILLILMVVVLALAFMRIALASTGYELTRSSVDAGAATSGGGNFTLSGTIGQPDAGTMSGGGFTLVGGFWGGSAEYRLFLPVILRNSAD